MHKQTKQTPNWTGTALQVLEAAANIISERYTREDAYSSPADVSEYLTYKLGGHEREVFAVMILDSQNRLIEYQELFMGTIDAASIHPREVVKAVLKANGATVIFSHNHPSGDAEPSTADKAITKRLTEALALIDVKVLDHIVIGENSVSFAERGLL